MSNNKQSSVEQLEFDLKLWFEIMKISFPTEIQNSINRAKRVHNKEIIEAWTDGDARLPESKSLKEAEEYYKRIFGGGNE